MHLFSTVKKTFDAVYGALPVPVFLFDGKADLVNANQAFLDLAGIQAKDIPTLSVSSFFAVLKTYKFPVPERYVTELTSRDGKVIPVEFNYQKFEGTGEATRGGIVFLIDLRENRTLQERIKHVSIEKEALAVQLAGEAPDVEVHERTKLEQQVKEEKTFLENVLESCGDGIIIFDGKGTITRVNESFARLTDKEKHELTGTTLFDLGPEKGTFKSTTGETITLDQSYRDYTYQQVEKFIQLESGDKLENWEYYIFNRHGEIVPLAATATMQKDDAGVITGSVCVLRDITERKKAEHALQEAYQFRNRFFANITHEFRTPLTLTIGPLEEIVRSEAGNLKNATVDQIGVALRNARRLLKLINQLLDFSMLESGVKNTVLEKRDLKKFMAAILDAFSLIAEKKKIALSFKPAADLPEVSIDPSKVEKVLFNLVGNAFKFTPDKGSIAVTVEQTSGFEGALSPDTLSAGAPLAAMGKYVKISVSDTGTGIPEKHLSKIFDRFDRGGLESPHGPGGAGIGLAYAKELVEGMGGCITVASNPGTGTTFSLYLPAVTPLKKAVEKTEDELMLQSTIELADVYQEPGIMQKSITGTKPLVLIADDNPDVRQYVVGIIKNEYDFFTARNGREALKQVKKHTPDVILCDVMMPEMDGYGVLQKVKADPALQQIPFIFLTARADTDMKVAGLEEGADDYIVKPFNSLELLARIKSLLRIRDLMSKTREQEKAISSLTQKLQEKYHYGSIIGNSPSMRKIYQLIETIKESDASVLISGETGTGKELVANAIHYNSLRRSGPMISVNCGAIPGELMERELFGHIKGAYTGADESRKGYFQEADTGTLFLDEIGEMDRDMQVKLLRVLERGEVIRVGDTKPRRVDVRIIAATNKNLLAEVQRGAFREDLYYRLHVIPLHLPPLRHRRDDIPLLIEQFMNDFAAKNSKKPEPVPESTMALFMNYAYPGNVRELRHIVERYCLLGGAENLFAPALAENDHPGGDAVHDDLLGRPSPLKAAAQLGKARAERAIIIHTLKLCDNDYNATARKLNISRSSMYEKLKNYGLKE